MIEKEKAKNLVKNMVNKAIAMMRRKSTPSENIYLKKIIAKQIFKNWDMERALF